MSMDPDDSITRTESPDDRSAPRHVDRLVIGQRFGPYLIVRLLGRGGMGQVYEAEHSETGRRLALKILSHTLTEPDARVRFLREGRLAASINHQHTVYIYGTEEIDGVPAITMELATGGTLKQRVEADGPLEVHAAVDTILQVISGLEAAAEAGVLHRDVKPSNCFVDADGRVKVGDFGLSIPAMTHADTRLTIARVVLGTPAYASPEQLQGGSLDVRSDLYSTGATLYYLLTGRPPFGGSDLVEVIANVLAAHPESPTRLRPELPDGLAHIVMRCLARDRRDRPQDYERLRQALTPFSSHAPAASPLGPRVVAAIIDITLVSMPREVLGLWTSPASGSVLTPGRVVASVLPWIIGFVWLEGWWGASIGKALMGIRVVGRDHRPPGAAPALLRTVLFSFFVVILPDIITRWLAIDADAMLREPARSSFDTLTTLLSALLVTLICNLLLFATARRANGYAGLHDLATRTRVVRRVGAIARDRLTIPSPPPDLPRDVRHIGPYAVIDLLDRAESATLLTGFDEVLRRGVWIRWLPIGSAAVAEARRDLARPGRLRWLSGRRSTAECWDAYEAPDGLPFAIAAGNRPPWSALRFWLVDVAKELGAVEPRTDRAELRLDHLWITNRGALILDWPAPDVRGASHRMHSRRPDWSLPLTDDPVGFLRRVAAAALGNSGAAGDRSSTAANHGGSFPLHARTFLKRLERREFPTVQAVVSALTDLLDRPTTLTRRRRVVHLALAAVVPVAALAAGAIVAVVHQRFDGDAIVAPFAGALALMASLAIWSAALLRGGLMLRAVGLAVVGPDGEEAPRQRALFRAIVAWSPAIVFLTLIGSAHWLIEAGALAVLAIGLVAAAVTPERGLQDRLANTRLVLR